MPKCRNCKEPAANKYGLTYACNVECVLEFGRKKRALIERRKIREAKKRLKTRAQWLKETQAVFNKWVRLRDHDKPCISCGRSSGAKINAGHFRTVKAAPQLRFNEDNCHLQCEHCNSFLSGNLLEYRPRLILKIGIDRVEALENNNGIQKYPIEELIALKNKFKRAIKEFEKERL